MSEIKPTFSGEMQLAGWSESHTGGCKVTFWLQSTEDLDAFRALTVRKGNTAGQRFMAALVEIGDDEKPIEYPPGSYIAADEKLNPTIGPIAYWLVLRCKEVEFFKFLSETYPEETYNWGHLSNEECCKNVVLLLCGCDGSRKEIDGNFAKTGLFNCLIRGPYQKYLAARGVVQ